MMTAQHAWQHTNASNYLKGLFKESFFLHLIRYLIAVIYLISLSYFLRYEKHKESIRMTTKRQDLSRPKNMQQVKEECVYLTVIHTQRQSSHGLVLTPIMKIGKHPTIVLFNEVNGVFGAARKVAGKNRSIKVALQSCRNWRLRKVALVFQPNTRTAKHACFFSAQTMNTSPLSPTMWELWERVYGVQGAGMRKQPHTLGSRTA